MTEISPLEAVRLILQWARENHLGPFNTLMTAGSVAAVFMLSRFARGAKKVVNDVHSVYAQALEDEKRNTDRLRASNQMLSAEYQRIADELAQERAVKETLLRTLARHRAKAASKDQPE